MSVKKIRDSKYVYYIYDTKIVTAINQNLYEENDKNEIKYVENSENMFRREVKYLITDFDICDEMSRRILLRKLAEVNKSVDYNLLSIVKDGTYKVRVTKEISPYLILENENYKFLFPLVDISEKYLSGHPTFEKCFETVG